jgi:transposase
MVRWRQETDLDLLRQAGELLERENERLVQKVIELTKQLLHAQGKDKDELQLRLAQLEADLAQQRKKLFGDSSEKRPRERETKERPKHPGHGPRPQPALPIEEVPHTLTPDEAGTCSLCKNPLEAWPNRFETNDEVDVVTRHFVIKRHQRQKYRCSCGASHVTAPGPDKLADGARYSLAFVAEVVVGKYVDHMPLERMVRIFGCEGLVIDSQTLWDQCNAAATLLAPAYARLRDWVLSFSVVGADETWWRLMSAKTSGGSTKRWYVWALGVEKGVHYRLFDDRSKEAARQLLEGYVAHHGDVRRVFELRSARQERRSLRPRALLGPREEKVCGVRGGLPARRRSALLDRHALRTRAAVQAWSRGRRRARARARRWLARRDRGAARMGARDVRNDAARGRARQGDCVHDGNVEWPRALPRRPRHSH